MSNGDIEGKGIYTISDGTKFNGKIKKDPWNMNQGRYSDKNKPLKHLMIFPREANGEIIYKEHPIRKKFTGQVLLKNNKINTNGHGTIINKDGTSKKGEFMTFSN